MALLCGVILGRPPQVVRARISERLIPTWTVLDDNISTTEDLPPVFTRRLEEFSKEAPIAIRSSPRKQTIDRGPRYGIAAGSSLTSLSKSELDARFEQLRQLGVGWVRFDVEWNNIQPDNASGYRWEAYDRVVSAATAKQLNVLGIIDYTPAWARSRECPDNPKCKPADPETYAKFAADAASHYSGYGVNCWEIWNEPNNHDFYQPKPNLDSYSKMLELAAKAIKNVNSSAFVVSGSTSPAASDGTNISPIDFVSGLYSRGVNKYIDAIGHHPYTFPAPPDTAGDHAWNQMAATSKSIHSIMVNNGDSSKKVWITEFGSPTGGPGDVATLANYTTQHDVWHVDEALQAATVTSATNLFKSYTWVGLFFWYSYKDAGTTPDTNENFFGLVRADGSLKPAYYSYKAAIAATH